MITGLDEINANLTKFLIDTDKAIDQAVANVANGVRNTAVKSIAEISQGETVLRQRQGGGTYEHVASKPGDAPNSDTGALVRSVAVEHERGAKVAYVGTAIEYGPHLEFGTRKMQARPWLYPALDAHDGDLEQEVANEIQQELDKVGR